MRVVLDTNVLVSGIFWKGPPATILHAWREGRLELALSPAILEEYHRVALELGREFPQVNLMPIIEALTLGSTIVPDRTLPEPLCSDSQDDKFIAAALLSGAAFVITGDRALLKVREYQTVQIVTPRTFVSSQLGPTGP